jgi:hypothetical protein
VVSRGGFGWAGRGGVPGLPVLGPGPVSPQVQAESVAGGSDPGADVDDLRAQGCPSDLGEVGGDCGGAGDSERQRRVGNPGGVGRVLSARQVRQRSVLEFGDDLLDDRVFTVTLIAASTMDRRELVMNP